MEMRDAERENTLIDTFITPLRRERYRLLLANKRKRHEILDRLNHWFEFVPAFATEVAGGEHTVEGVLSLLRRRGMQDTDPVYILSDIRALDTLHLPLREALKDVLEAQFASIVCCVAGRLAYYRPEAPAKGYLLEAPKPGVRSEKRT
jgi:hypothetical protein